MSNKDDGMMADPLLMVASSGSMSDDQELEVTSMPDPELFMNSAYDDDDEDDDEAGVVQGTASRSMVMEPLQSKSPAHELQPQYGDARKPTQQPIEDVVMLDPAATQQEQVAATDNRQDENSFTAEPQRKHPKQVKEKKKLPPFVKYLLIAFAGIIACLLVIVGLSYMMQSNRATDQIDLTSIEDEAAITEEEQTPVEVVLPTPSQPAKKAVSQEDAPKPAASDANNASDSALNARVDQVTSKLNMALGKLSELNESVGQLKAENEALKEANASLSETNSKLTAENTALKSKNTDVSENKSAPLPTKGAKNSLTASKAPNVKASPVVTAKVEKPVKKIPYKRPVVKHQAAESKSQQFLSVRNTSNSQPSPFVSTNGVALKPAYEVISVMNGKVVLKDPSKATDAQVYSSGNLVPGYGSIATISDNGCVQFTSGQNLCRR